MYCRIYEPGRPIITYG
jgi:hypothetical protein